MSPKHAVNRPRGRHNRHDRATLLTGTVALVRARQAARHRGLLPGHSCATPGWNSAVEDQAADRATASARTAR